MDLTPLLHDTETECQLYLNNADILNRNTTSRKDRVSNQHNDNIFQMNTASAKGSITEPKDNSNADIPHIITPQAYSWAPNNNIDTHPTKLTQSNHHNIPSSKVSNYDTNTELEVPYSDIVDYKTNATEEPSSSLQSDLGNQLYHMDQNIISRTSQNNHIMLYTDTQAQQCNNADHINHHVNHTNNGNRLNTNNNHYHNTALSNSSDSNNSTHTIPTAQLSGG